MPQKKNGRQRRRQARSREFRRQEEREFKAKFYEALDEDRQEHRTTEVIVETFPCNTTM